MLSASALECTRGDRRLFSGVGFELAAGGLLALQGGNGSGKTSLLRILCGLAPPASGEVCWDRQPIGGLGGDYRRRLFYLGHANAIKDELTPLENLLAGTTLAEEAIDSDAACAALGRFGLATRADLACRHLSQGQKRRVALARLEVTQRPLWLLDEPFVALDAAAVTLVASLIGKHLQRGGLCVLTTHQPVEVPGARRQELRLD